VHPSGRTLQYYIFFDEEENHHEKPVLLLHWRRPSRSRRSTSMSLKA